MREILRERSALTLVLVGLCAVAVGYLLFAISAAVFSAASVDLSRAGIWVYFVGPVAVLCGAVWVGWRLVTFSQWLLALEVGGVALGALFLSIGALLTAVNSSSSSHDVWTGLGYGFWAGVALALGLKWAITQRPQAGQAPPGAAFPNGAYGQRGVPSLAPRPIPPLWFCAGLGLLLFAVGSAIPSNGGTAGSTLAGGIVAAIGCGVFVAALVAARHLNVLPGVPPTLIAGVSVVGVAVLFYGIAEYILSTVASYTPNRDRVLLTVAFGLYVIAFLILIGPVGVQIQRIFRTPARYGPSSFPARLVGPVPAPQYIPSQPAPGQYGAFATAAPPAQPQAQAAPAPAPAPTPAVQTATSAPPAAFCSQCGSARPAGARFCRSCGAPFDAA